jgi:hypothetical protein
MGRPKGSRNRSTRAFRDLVSAMDRSGEINLRGLVLALYGDATSDNPAVRLPARRELLSRVYGLPRQELAIEHGVSESAVEMLARIAASPEHRLALESLERERRQRQLAAVTVELESNTGTKEDAN